MLMDMSLSKFNIYQNAATPICFRATQTLDVLIFFKKRTFSDFWSEIHLIQSNILSTGQCVRDSKIYIQVWIWETLGKWNS